MLVGNIHYPGTYENLLTHPTWKKVLDWLRDEAAQKEDGENEIQGRDIYASVSTVDTMPRDKGTYEAHKQYIDVHYCIDGSELIEWAHVQTLGTPIEENREKDYALFSTPNAATSISMTPGTFAIFFPEDAHMPKLSVIGSPQVKKAVVKVHMKLLEEK